MRVPFAAALAVLVLSSLVSGAPLRVLPLGDSITRGWGSFDEGGYRSYVAQAMPPIDWLGTWSDGPPIAQYHAGYNGFTIRRLYTEAFTDPRFVAMQPDVILLMAGTNDAWHGTGLDAPERMIGNTESLIDEIYARWPGVSLLISNIIHIYDFGQGIDYQTVYDFNAQLPGLVLAQQLDGREVHLVDSFSRVSISELADGVHPTDLGYRHIADAYLDVLGRVIPEPALAAVVPAMLLVFRRMPRRARVASVPGRR